MAPTILTTIPEASWGYLFPEVRLMILEALLEDGCSLAPFVTVSREWQSFIERHVFARIRLTPTRLSEFSSMIHRNRSLVSYIWFCLEIPSYDCARCAPQDVYEWGFSNSDSTLVIKTLQDLFSALSTWEPNGHLLLDIDVHSTRTQSTGSKN